ncbi:protein NEOXANTHIN-DEFICIENT 1 isoform X1 [Brassica napus]|uniref:protein NEOXANTHIN-DEFICIENT 1 isoform X1 n=1 Tax=Brassica napus TaxID=3708 RepID=UPI002078A62B|nr:protein NEOXANTHIN-DEFICIENT 1 isoform X1 [Brassica napus]XP_048592607.1 protein NEOXANTHIN-DEFICIENT 1 isoform X1 [Brassica napus]
MEVEERNVSSGYAKPPWIFKGSALYQIHLVKASTARAFIPKEFRLVEAFGYKQASTGYTLGGFFLASYDDSPAGVFDELVMIAGIVWNPPTSCAWAARVLVNSNEACHHGRKVGGSYFALHQWNVLEDNNTFYYKNNMVVLQEVGLPSQFARFSKKITAVPKRKRERAFGFLDTFGLGTTLSHPEDLMEVKVSEVDSAASANICNIQIRSDELETKLGKWMGPAIKMSLPSFSGNTKFNPNLLKYSCHIHCRVRPVSPAVVSKPLEDEADKNHTSQESLENERRLSVAVMLSKPIIALQFKDLTMQVEAPVVVHPSV